MPLRIAAIIFACGSMAPATQGTAANALRGSSLMRLIVLLLVGEFVLSETAVVDIWAV
jgi:hypothetical protein